jgi:glutathione synthase/RimK-type ligase-like ATP-grasp enzyme
MEAPIPSHYPYVTRMVVTLWRAGLLTNVDGVEIEPEFGYVTRLRYTNGSYRVTRGNDVGLNSAAATETVKDKAYTKFFLHRSGFESPRGQSFLLPWWAEQLRPRMGESPMRTADQVSDFVHEELGFPVYVKPVDGSKGSNVWRVDDDDLLTTVLDRYERERVKVALVERAISLPDYRVVVLDGKLISAYRRDPMAVTGNGTSTIAELIEGLQVAFRSTGRDSVLRADDPRILAKLRRDGRDLSYVPRPGAQLTLHDISNLSAGGTAHEVTSAIADRWVHLAATIADVFGLRFCGVDLACSDITSDTGSYAVIEVNGAPGLDHYVSTGPDQESVVRRLYLRVLNAPPR